MNDELRQAVLSIAGEVDALRAKLLDAEKRIAAAQDELAKNRTEVTAS